MLHNTDLKEVLYTQHCIDFIGHGLGKKKTVFLEDTVIMSFARGERSVEIDEHDTVKMDL